MNIIDELAQRRGVKVSEASKRVGGGAGEASLNAPAVQRPAASGDSVAVERPNIIDELARRRRGSSA